MEDMELEELQALKAKLLKKAKQLVTEMKEKKAQHYTLTSTKNRYNNTSSLSDTVKASLCKASCRITGLKFEDLDKHWKRDNIYCYTGRLLTKALTLSVELTVCLKNAVDFEILDITCSFVNIDDCYMMEIEPWVQDITKLKNFSLLMSAISQYSECHAFRNKVMDVLKEKRYGTANECTKENGGVLIDIQSPDNPVQIYLQFQWSILFLERTFSIKHFFVINPTEAGIRFAEDYEDLLKQFCKIDLTNSDLAKLWEELYSAIALYEDESENTAKPNK